MKTMYNKAYTRLKVIARLTYISTHASTGISSNHDTIFEDKSKRSCSLSMFQHALCIVLEAIKLQQTKGQFNKVALKQQTSTSS